MNEKIIYIGSDHGGYSLKNHLKQYLIGKGYNVIDMGCDTLDPQDDYPDFAKKVAKEVQKGESLGILICRYGIGMSMAANKVKGIYVALVDNEVKAKMARGHNNANIITLAAEELDNQKAELIIASFLNSEFEGERHTRRLNKIKAIENEH